MSIYTAILARPPEPLMPMSPLLKEIRHNPMLWLLVFDSSLGWFLHFVPVGPRSYEDRRIEFDRVSAIKAD